MNKREAVANADAHLNNVGMPTYTELRTKLQEMVKRADKHHGSPHFTSKQIMALEDFLERCGAGAD